MCMTCGDVITAYNAVKYILLAIWNTFAFSLDQYGRDVYRARQKVAPKEFG